MRTDIDTVRSVMHGDVLCLNIGASLREAAEALATEEVGAAVVTDEGQVVGILSERDIVRGLGEGADPDRTAISDVMTEEPICADPEDTLDVAAEKMMHAGIRHLPVLGSGDPIGMLSARDVLSAFAEFRLE